MNKSEQYRLGYYILMPDGMLYRTIAQQAFDDDEKEEFFRVTKVALEIEPILRAYEIVDLSYREIRLGLDRAANLFGAIPGSPFGGISLVQDAHLLVFLKVAAFLSSVRSFLEHTKSTYMRLYGPGSSQGSAFTAHTRKCFDDNESYRFIEGLRDRSQHTSLPISIIKLDIRRDQTAQNMNHEVSILMDTAALLDEGFNWKSQAKADLKRRPPRFDLLPIIDTEMSLIRELFCGCISRRAEEIQACNAYLGSLLVSITPPPEAVVVLWKVIPAHMAPPSNFLVPPFEDMRRIANIVKVH